MAETITETKPEVVTEEVSLEELARTRIEIKEKLDEMNEKIRQASEELEKQYEFAYLTGKTKEIDPILIDRIKKLGEWSYKIDRWILAIHKAGRKGFKIDEFRQAVKTLVEEKAPMLLQYIKELEEKMTTLPDPEAFKLELRKEKIISKRKTYAGFLLDLWNKFVDWLGKGFEALSRKIESTMDDIDEVLGELFVEASLDKQAKVFPQNQKYDKTKGLWAVDKDGKYIVDKDPLRDKIDQIVGQK